MDTDNRTVMVRGKGGRAWEEGGKGGEVGTPAMV